MAKLDNHQLDRMIRTCHVGLSELGNFFQKVGNGHLVISSLFKGVPRVSSLPFEPLDIRGHPHIKIKQFNKKSIHFKSASVLEP